MYYMNIKLSASRSGFTLAEVLVAMLILAIGMTSIVSALRFALRTSAVSDETATALAEARQEMEELYGKGFADPALSDGTHTLARADYTASYLVSTPSPTLKQVRMTVSHRGFTGVVRQVQLSMQLSQAMR